MSGEKTPFLSEIPEPPKVDIRKRLSWEITPYAWDKPRTRPNEAEINNVAGRIFEQYFQHDYSLQPNFNRQEYLEQVLDEILAAVIKDYDTRLNGQIFAIYSEWQIQDFLTLLNFLRTGGIPLSRRYRDLTETGLEGEKAEKIKKRQQRKYSADDLASFFDKNLPPEREREILDHLKQAAEQDPDFLQILKKWIDGSPFDVSFLVDKLKTVGINL